MANGIRALLRISLAHFHGQRLYMSDAEGVYNQAICRYRRVWRDMQIK